MQEYRCRVHAGLLRYEVPIYFDAFYFAQLRSSSRALLPQKRHAVMVDICVEDILTVPGLGERHLPRVDHGGVDPRPT